MAAQNVTSDNGDSNKIVEGARVVVRSSSGVPYVVTENLSDTSVDVWGRGLSSTTYYFDGSDAAASAPDGGWDNVTNADDGSVDTDATATESGSETTKYLQIEGTNATGTDPIIVVEARMHDGISWGNYQAITQPSGGWTLTKVQGLEVRVAETFAGQFTAWFYEDGNAGGTELMSHVFTVIGTVFSKIEVRVTTYDSTSTTWGELDAGNNPSANVYGSASAAIDSNDIIHIIYMMDDIKDSQLLYIQFDTTDGTFKNGEVVVDDLGADIVDLTEGHTAIAIDSNDVPHVAFRNDEKSDDWTINYINNVDSAWNSGDYYEVEGETNGKVCSYPDITIDADDKPCISYGNSTDNDVGTAQGNANDATSFDLNDVYDGAGSSYFPSITVDSSGNHWVSFNHDDNYIYIISHDYGDAWASWNVAITDGTNLPGNLLL